MPKFHPHTRTPTLRHGTAAVAKMMHAAVAAAVLGTAAAARAPEKPNILYLMAGAPAHWPTLLS